MRAFLAVTLAILLPTVSATAQDTPDPLVVPFTPIAPFMMLDGDGTRSGFIVELSEMIGAEIGVPIAYLEVANSREFVAAQVAGDTQMIAGILQLPPLQGTNLFSDVVVTETLFPATLLENEDAYADGTITGQRIGIVPPATGSDAPILDENLPIEFESPQAALMALLSGETDLILLPPPVVYGMTRGAGLDGRVTFLPIALRETTRHVALHDSRADLLGPINSALARIEADGRLEELRLRYNLALPDLPPDVLSVGITHFPPMMIVQEDGNHTGFNVEVMNTLAEQAGLQIRYEVLERPDFAAGPVSGGVDIQPGLIDTPSRRAVMDMTYPFLERPIGVLLPEDLSGGVTVVGDLQGYRIGTNGGSGVEEQLLAVGSLDVTGFASVGEAIAAQLAGDTDVTVLPRQVMEVALEEQGGETDLVIVDLQDETIARIIALRPGLGSVRDQLNAVIPGYLLSDEFFRLRNEYLAPPQIWTRARVIRSLAIAGAAALLIIGAILASTIRTRIRAATAIATVRDELETIFEVATSGIVALDASGQIVRVNTHARHMLGGIADPTPFPWPEQIKFLEGDNLTPLDASADPIRRALNGHALRSETHLMRRAHGDRENRYVRVDNAMPENQESGIHTVLVLDDVSNEERNRQVIERKSRLDALGQLTGGIAHDFNNLLASQLYAIDLARKAPSPERRNRYLETAENSIKRGRSLTSRLLAFARRQPGLATVMETQTTLHDFEQLVRPMLEAQIALTIHTEHPDLRHFCDQAQLETALMNLTLNSRDAILRAGKGTQIDIRARAVRASREGLDDRQDAPAPDTHGGSYRYVEISVTDNGPGMDEETLARSTDPFFTTKDSNSGTGLGLAMVYGFARQSDGDLRIYSEEGIGTTVQLTLPRGTSDGLRETRMPIDAVSPGHGETILVVEDELQLLVMITEVLQDLGYNVISSASGQEALNIIEGGEPFDLLITDVVMPGKIGGFELARRLRRIHPTKPVIYTSGYTGFTASEMGEVQAPLLQKPAPPEELSRAISKALGKEAVV